MRNFNILIRVAHVKSEGGNLTMQTERKFDLQLFAEEGGSQKETDESNENNENKENQTEENNPSAGTKNTGNAEEKESKQENSKSEKENKIPYERFKEVNDSLKQFKEVFSELGLEKPEDLKEFHQTFQQLKEEKEAKEREEMDEVTRVKTDYEKEKDKREKLEQQLQELQTNVQQEKIYNQFIKLANQNNIEYVDDAFKLADISSVKVTKDGKIEGVEDVITNLIEEKPFLVKQDKKEPKTIGGANAGNEKSEKTAEQMLEEAAEAARKSNRTEDKANYAKLKRELLG